MTIASMIGATFLPVTYYWSSLVAFSLTLPPAYFSWTSCGKSEDSTASVAGRGNSAGPRVSDSACMTGMMIVARQSDGI